MPSPNQEEENPQRLHSPITPADGFNNQILEEATPGSRYLGVEGDEPQSLSTQQIDVTHGDARSPDNNGSGPFVTYRFVANVLPDQSTRPMRNPITMNLKPIL